MSCQKHIHKVDYAEDPAPADNDEENKYNDVHNAFRSEHNGQSHKQFTNPTNEGDEQKNGLQKRRLTIKPLIEFHDGKPP